MMNSEKFISRMEMSLNCILLGKTSFEDTFAVNVADKNQIIDVYVNKDSLKISDLKFLIWNKKKDTLRIKDPDIMKLWKVNIAESEEDRLKEFEEDNIVGAEFLKPNHKFKDYFKKEELAELNIHVIVQLPAAAAETVIDVINIVLKKHAIAKVNIDTMPGDKKMPFMERDTDHAISRIKRNIDSNLEYSTSKTDYDILVSGGAPGIGKTRFGQELFRHLENSQDQWVPKTWTESNLHLKDIYLDFGNGCKLDPYDEVLNSTIIIGLRIAYVVFIERKYDMSFVTFRDRVWEHRNIFKIPNVFNCISKHLKLESNQQLFVFLHIDEFQLIDQWESNRKMAEKKLFKEMINDLAVHMLGPPSKIYVQTFLSGTAPQVVISAKESSKVSFGFVHCPQLSLRAMLNIANHYAQKYDAEKFACGTYKWMLCQPFLQLLEDTGGLPRALQYVFYECFRVEGNGKEFFKKIDQQNFDTIFGAVKDFLQERYNIYKTIEDNTTLALELLYHSIDAIPVSRTKCLDESKKDHTIENLERDAHIILNPCNDNSSNFTINMPFFFICIYNDRLKIVNGELQKAFRLQSEMNWQSWETFVANYDAFRTNLLIRRGKKSALLSELYRGADGTAKTLNIEVELKELSVCYAKQQFPCEKLTDKKSISIIDWAKGENVIVNGVSAACGDAFVVRGVVQTYKKDKKYILILHQCKYYQSGTYFTVDMLQGEHIKNLEGSFDTKGRHREILEQCQHITIAFTIQPFDDPIIPDDCLVIMKSNFKEYFGPVFASRATFFMTRNINPNFSDFSWMINEIPGVGQLVASDIINTRPHLSEGDFYKKFIRIKRSIGNYEEKNPGKKIKLDFHPFNV